MTVALSALLLLLVLRTHDFWASPGVPLAAVGGPRDPLGLLVRPWAPRVRFPSFLGNYGRHFGYILEPFYEICFTI